MKRLRRPLRRCAALAPLLLAALPAHAHLVDTGLGPIYDGIAHFALTPEDLLPALALAVLAGLRGADAARRVVFVLPAAWLCAAGLASALSWSWPGLPAWLPLLALGALVTLDRPLPKWTLTAIALALGLLLGAANGSAMAQAGPGVRGAIGVVGALFVASTLVAAAAVAWQRGWLRIAWRVAGSWLAASGLLLLGWSLR
ncbi:MAG: HupE/UreJ family protein [Burkholderiaceae bacterium]|nr:HupE/UreJ family protein [Burkholderiaceae bacterium]